MCIYHITESPSSSQEESTNNQQSTNAILDTGSTFMNYQHKDSNVIHIGVAFPPISGKLINWIEQGSSIEMAELLLKSLRHIATDDNQPAVPKPK